MTSLSASCNTIRRSKQLHLDPGKMAWMVWSSCATHPSNCTRLWLSKHPQSTRKIYLVKLKCHFATSRALKAHPELPKKRKTAFRRCMSPWRPREFQKKIELAITADRPPPSPRVVITKAFIVISTKVSMMCSTKRC